MNISFRRFIEVVIIATVVIAMILAGVAFVMYGGLSGPFITIIVK